MCVCVCVWERRRARIVIAEHVSLTSYVFKIFLVLRWSSPNQYWKQNSSCWIFEIIRTRIGQVFRLRNDNFSKTLTYFLSLSLSLSFSLSFSSLSLSLSLSLSKKYMYQHLFKLPHFFKTFLYNYAIWKCWYPTFENPQNVKFSWLLSLLNFPKLSSCLSWTRLTIHSDIVTWPFFHVFVSCSVQLVCLHVEVFGLVVNIFCFSFYITIFFFFKHLLLSKIFRLLEEYRKAFLSVVKALLRRGAQLVWYWRVLPRQWQLSTN